MQFSNLHTGDNTMAASRSKPAFGGRFSQFPRVVQRGLTTRLAVAAAAAGALCAGAAYAVDGAKVGVNGNVHEITPA